jgi:hypothetical protein
MKKSFITLIILMTIYGLYSQDTNQNNIPERIRSVKKFYRFQKRIEMQSLDKYLSSIKNYVDPNINLLSSKSIIIKPNPTNGILKCIIQLQVSVIVEISIIDIFGNKMVKEKVNLNKDSNEILLDISHLNNGWYNIFITDYHLFNFNNSIIKY